MKKLEVIFESVKLNQVLRILKENGAAGYTLIHDVAGMGKHGSRQGFELTDATTNVMLMVVDESEKIYSLAQKISSALSSYSGMILISETEVYKVKN